MGCNAMGHNLIAKLLATGPESYKALANYAEVHMDIVGVAIV